MGRGIRHLIDAIGQQDPRTVAGRLTLLLMALYGERLWHLNVPTIMIAAAGLVVPGLIQTRTFWILLAALQGLVVLPNAYVVDNHKLLLFYWTIALACSTRSSDTLRLNARLLIGWCFLLAAVWKIALLEYFDGAFLHFTMLTDPRFRFFSNWGCGVALETLHENEHRLSLLALGLSDREQLLDSPFVATVSLIGSYWTLGTELAIGVLFLCWDKATRWVTKLRNLILMQFIVLTYPIASVIGFGWLLSIMGYAQCRGDQSVSRVAFLGLFVLLQIFLIPWGPLLIDLS